MIECFKLQLLYQCNDAFPDIREANMIYRRLCDQIKILDDPIIIFADPFLFVHNEILYLFYEKKTYSTYGIIEMIQTEDLIHWSCPKTVLKEDYHISYPFVFKSGNKVYMMPETSLNHSVCIYEADNSDLASFSYKAALLRRDNLSEDVVIDFSDSSVYERNGVFYLMTTVNRNGVNELELWTSRNLFGGYVLHNISPVVRSQKYGRNAGCIFEWNGNIYRVAQDCEKRYGDNVHLFRIDELTENTYRETLVKENLIPTDMKFYQEGGHHFNIARFKGKTVMATDAKEYHTLLFARLKNKAMGAVTWQRNKG